MLKVTHENGYTGVAYGMSSLSLYKDNKEVLHTGSLKKQFQTEEELYKYLEEVPEFFKILDDDEIFKKIIEESE